MMRPSRSRGMPCLVEKINNYQFFRSDSGTVPKKFQKCYFFENKSCFVLEKRTFLHHYGILNLNLYFFCNFVFKSACIFGEINPLYTN
jgi:hypothetical protein